MSNIVSTLFVAAALLGGAAFAYVQKNPGALDEMMAARTTTGAPGADYKRTKVYAECRKDYAPMLNKKSLNDQRAACECFDHNFSQWPEDMQKAAFAGRAIAMAPKLVQAAKPKPDMRKMSKNDIQNIVMQEKTKRQEMATRIQEGMSANPASAAAVMFKVQALLRACKVM